MRDDENLNSSDNSNYAQYLEIYKLYVNTITEMSNRRVNVNRYYVLALSVIVLALSAILRGGNMILDFFTGNNNMTNELGGNMDIIGYIVFITSVLAIFLSISWLRNILGYLKTNSKRYKIVNNIESVIHCKIDNVFQISSEFASGYPKNYFSSAFHETITPIIFAVGFSCLTIIGSKLFTDSRWVLCVPLVVIVHLGIYISIQFFRWRNE